MLLLTLAFPIKNLFTSFGGNILQSNGHTYFPRPAPPWGLWGKQLKLEPPTILSSATKGRCLGGMPSQDQSRSST